MADYFAILRKAILAQDVESGETRRQVYEKARSALLSQLKAVTPPLPPSDIARQRLGLEEAIRTIERQIADGVFDTAPERNEAAAAIAAVAAKASPAPQPDPEPAQRRQGSAAALVKNAVRQAAVNAAIEEEYEEPLPAEGTASAERGRARGGQRARAAERMTDQRSRAAANADPVSAVLNQSFSSEFDTHIEEPEEDDIVPDLEQFRPELARTPPATAGRQARLIPDPDDAFVDEEPANLPVADPDLARPTAPQSEVFEPQPDLPPSASLSPALQELRAERQNSPPSAVPFDDDDPFVEPEEEIDDGERLTPFNSFDPVNTWDEKENPFEPEQVEEPVFPEDDDQEPYRFEEESKPIVRTRFIEEAESRRPALKGLLRRNRTMISLGAIGLVLIVVVGLVVSVLFDGTTPTDEPVDVIAQPEATTEDTEPSGQIVQPRIVRTVDPNSSEKISDRLLTTPTDEDGEAPSTPEDPAQPSNISSETVEAPTPTAPETTVAEVIRPAGGNEKAVLYEAPTEGGNSGEAFQASVDWGIEGAGSETIISAKVDVPEKGIFMNLSIKENNDDTLPASHLIEVRFRTDDNFGGKNVDTTPGMFMKNTEQERGLPLIGASAKVSDNYFWIALSSNPVDEKRNKALMLERAWFDIPVQYGTGRQAIITVAKGNAGQQIFDTAFGAWEEQ